MNKSRYGARRRQKNLDGVKSMQTKKKNERFQEIAFPYYVFPDIFRCILPFFLFFLSLLLMSQRHLNYHPGPMCCLFCLWLYGAGELLFHILSFTLSFFIQIRSHHPPTHIRHTFLLPNFKILITLNDSLTIDSNQLCLSFGRLWSSFWFLDSRRRRRCRRRCRRFSHRGWRHLKQGSASYNLIIRLTIDWWFSFFNTIVLFVISQLFAVR